ncbi:MAG: ATP-binding protein [Patescibacteria group bacterium]
MKIKEQKIQSAKQRLAESISRLQSDLFTANTSPDTMRLMASLGMQRKRARMDAEYLQQAMMNIFEDLELERSGNTETQKAVINILEDLQDEITAKNRFLAILSHELRNPMAPITSSLEYIKLRGIEDEELKGSIAMIEHQFGVLTRLLKELLDVARISSNKLQLNVSEIRLQELIDHTVNSINPLLEEARHTLEISLPDQPVVLIADSLRLEQIIVNLLSNAIKYTESGGTIWLRVRLENGSTIIEVQDTGRGISRQMISQIFNLFTQEETPSAHFKGGLGIGLALVRSLVELHGGTVSAKSEGLGKGSIFTVKLPLIPVRTMMNGNSTEGGVKILMTQNILIVDDNKDAADAMKKLLGFAGFNASAVYSGREALTAVFREKPNIVLLDIRMPELDGYAVATKLRTDPQLSDVVLIALTGFGQEEDKMRAQRAGFNHHLTKPASLADLKAIFDLYTS